MKRIFTLSVLTIFVATLFSACVKQRADIDESYWLSQERAYVVYSESSCPYYVVETNDGYTILKAWGGGYKPYEGAVLYGDFSRYGVSDFYNRSSGLVITAEVKEYWLSYYDAQIALDYYCY